MSDFFKNLMLSAPALPDRMFPTFVPVKPLRGAVQDHAVLDDVSFVKPVYSYDLSDIENVLLPELTALDDIMTAKRKQMMASLINGVMYETGITDEKGSTFIWARPVRVHPDFAPHVMAWGDVLIGAVISGDVV